MIRLTIFFFITLVLFSCNEKPDYSQLWKIGGKHGMSNVIVDQDKATDVKICSDYYKDIGFSTNVNVDYDDKTYFGLFEGLCITLNAKKIRIRFATPSSGKRAEGTFEILELSSK